MAHIQKRCSGCRKKVPRGARSCAACGSRELRHIARYVTPDGHERSEWFARAIDAETRVAQVEADKARGDWIDPRLGAIPLEAFYANWRAKAAGLSPTTLDKYDRAWRLDVAPALGPVPLAQITRAAVRNMLARAEARASAWQATEALKLLRRLLNAAMDEERIRRNAAARVSTPETRRRAITILRPEQLHAAADALPDRFRALALLGGYSSLRWSELVAVKRDDLDLEGRRVRVDERLTEVGGGGGRWAWGKPKTAGSAREVDLPEVVIRPLAEHLLRFPPLRDQDDPRLDGLVFTPSTEDGEQACPVRRHTFRREWHRACARAGVPPIRLEWLRHTGARDRKSVV